MTKWFLGTVPDKLAMYSFPEPPYFLLIVGLLVSLVCGLTFAAMLRQSERKWLEDSFHHQPIPTFSDSEVFNNMQKLQISLPFVGTCMGVCVFFASVLDIFGVPTWLAYLTCIPVSVAVGFIVWFEIGSRVGKRMLRVFLYQSAELFRGV